MALITCHECGKKISDQAISCPHCGAPISIAKQKQKRELIFKPAFVQPITGMTIDKAHRTFSCGLFNGVHSFDDIIDIDIYENGSSLSKTSTASVIGRAAIGSLFNPVGAVIGGVTAKKKTVDIVNSIEIHLTMRSEHTPLIKISIPIPKKTKKDSKDYKKAITKAKETVAAIKNLQMS